MPTMDSQRAGGQLSGMRVLVLGGTTEASALARLLAGDTRFEATLSFAGRTVAPNAQPIATRIGGFGGVEGLVSYLRDQKISAAVDATHPYAAQISANAVAACAEAKVKLASLVRPAWQRRDGDDWRPVGSAEAAADALGTAPCTVFLSVGRQELPAFARAPQHRYLARTVDAPEGVLPPDIRIVQARGPFDYASELALLTSEKIAVVVSKNSGGRATYAKIDAARTLKLPVVMIERPHKPAGELVGGPEAAVSWLAAQARLPRGV
jgi:precorrin-6A/cobalt-precorrin-6A reductase